MDLDSFTAGWDNHPLCTEQNLTSNQLWTIGCLQYPVAAPENLEVDLKNVESKLCLIRFTHCLIYFKI